MERQKVQSDGKMEGGGKIEGGGEREGEVLLLALEPAVIFTLPSVSHSVALGAKTMAL